MSFPSSHEEHAVFFFEDKKLVRQLLWLEFEAVLDGFVPLVEQAGQKVRAVYLTIAPGPAAIAAVFFLIDFDKNGFADRRWNIPLDQLSENSAEGPDLGAGAIKLACKSQCSISWHKEQLWDPDFQSKTGHFAVIRQAVSANRLNLDFQVEEPEPDAPEADTHHNPAQTQQTLKEQQLILATLEEKQRQEVDRIKREHQQQLESYQAELEREKQVSERQRHKISDLESQVDNLRQKVHSLREYFEEEFDHLKSADKAAMETLSRQHEIEIDEAVREAVSSLRDQLQLRDIEMMYRDTQMSSLQDEIGRLQQEKQSLLENSGNKLLDRLHASGISFVTFQPGAGQITVPLDSLVEFMDDKIGFVSARCGVPKSTYARWLAHFKNPRCTAELEQGRTCGRSIQRINQPAEFNCGSSDHCAQHQQVNHPVRDVASS